MDTTVSKDELQTVLAQLNMTVDDPELYRVVIGANLEVTALVDAVELPIPEIPERKWWRPEPEDNALGAWYVRTDIHGAAGGKLAGRTIALKDTVLLAGKHCCV